MPESRVLPEFQRLQFAFTAHLRDPEKSPAPTGIEDRRMKIYRELFYNNVEGFIANGFPVLRSLYYDASWHRLVRDYFARHQAHTPFFHGIAEEFLQYLQHERSPQPEDPSFLLELAHYEWVELALNISEAEAELSAVNPEGDLLEAIPALSPLAWNLAYQYPVQRISAKFQPQEAPAQPTHIVVYRNAQDRVNFLEINMITARLLQLLEEQPAQNGRQLLEQIAQELQHLEPGTVVSAGYEMLMMLRDRGIILGTRR